VLGKKSKSWEWLLKRIVNLFVRVRWRGGSLVVPLAQLKPRGADAATSEAIADWHYWVARRYKF